MSPRSDAKLIERRREATRQALLVLVGAMGYEEHATIVAQYMAGEPVRDRIGTVGTQYLDLMCAVIHAALPLPGEV